jgi:hypothetical protein
VTALVAQFPTLPRRIAATWVTRDGEQGQGHRVAVTFSDMELL